MTAAHVAPKITPTASAASHPTFGPMMRAVKDRSERFAKLDGFLDWMHEATAYMKLTSTPGWENGVQNSISTDEGDVGAPVLANPGAKPIGHVQWMNALMIAAGIAAEVPEAKLPLIDPEGTDASIFFTWAFSSTEGLTLKVTGSLVSPEHRWTQRIDGADREFRDAKIEEVVASLRAVLASHHAKGRTVQKARA